MNQVNAARRLLTPGQLEASQFGLVSRLADDLAHEVKNPLHALVINLEVLKKRVEKGATAAALERTAVLEHEVHRLHGMVDALLRLLRPEKGPAAPMSFGELWGQLGLLIHLRAKLARIELTEEGLPEDAYMAVAPHVVRYALLGVSEYVLDAAVAGAQPIRLVGSETDQDIELTFTTGAKPVRSTDDFDGLGFAAQLLQQAGGTVEAQRAGRSPSGTAILIRIPRANYT